MKREKEKYVTESTLIKERGWTKSLIEKFLQGPDLVVKNPHYRSGPGMKLYLIERISPFESQEIFLKTKIKKENRKVAAAKAVETKKLKLDEYINNIEIHIEKYPIEEIYENAINHYNNFQDIRNRTENWIYEPPSKLDKSFLNRISVNYIRHQLTNYEDELDEIFGKTGKFEAYCTLKTKIMKKISEIYPELKSECDKQIMINE